MPKGYDFPLFVKCLLGTLAMCGEKEEEDLSSEAAAAKAKAAEAKAKLDKGNGLVPKGSQEEKSKAPSGKKENLKDILDDGDEDEFAEVLTVEEKKLLGMRIGRGRAGEGGA